MKKTVLLTMAHQASPDTIPQIKVAMASLGFNLVGVKKEHGDWYNVYLVFELGADPTPFFQELAKNAVVYSDLMIYEGDKFQLAGKFLEV